MSFSTAAPAAASLRPPWAGAPRCIPSTRSSGDGAAQTPRTLTASTRIGAGRLRSAANAVSRASASLVPVRRLALIARRSSGWLVNRRSSSSRARAGSAAAIDPSSLIARAASVTTRSSASARKRATSA